MEVIETDLDKLHEDNPRDFYGTPEESALFDASMAKEQHYPILIRPHATLAGFFLVVDGHRRFRSAKRLGWKRMKAILVKAGLKDWEIRLIQSRIDLQHRKLSDPERRKVIREVAAAHPSISGKQLAEMLEMDQTVLSRYRGLDRLIPEADVAFASGRLSLKAAAEISTLSADEQPALLQVRLGGGTVADMAEEKRKRNQKPNTDTEKVEKLPVALNAGAVIIRAKKGAEPMNLAGARQLLLDALAKLDAAIKDGFSVKTARLAFEDTKNKVRKARKPRDARA